MGRTVRHIIIVEDENDVREFLVRAFSHYAPHANVTACPNGAAALKVYLAEGCDLVVSDQRMPVMTGLELLHAVRSQNSALPFVLISADPSIEGSALAAGVSSFIYKPLTIAQIRGIVETWLPPVT